MSKKIGKKRFLNCWIPIIILLFKRRINGIIFTNFFHLVGITKKGNYIHFATTRRVDRLAPVIFEGQIKISRAYRIKRKHWRIL